MADDNGILAMTARIVSAYVGANRLDADRLPDLMRQIHRALYSAGTGGGPEAEPKRGEPAVPIRKSVTPDHLVCLEDGLHFKSLKRHLAASHNMTPSQYRERWRLSGDYPIVATAFAEARSKIARASGLGQKGRGSRKKRGPQEQAS